MNITEFRDVSLGFMVGARAAEKVPEGYACVS
jgi:hypothetical protein